MSEHVLRARPARGESSGGAFTADPDVLAGYVEDAAHFPGGHAAAVVSPLTERDVVEVLRRTSTILPVGAQSSLTGGATPFGDVVLTTRRMTRIADLDAEHVRVQAGVTLTALDEWLARRQRWYPPAPTFAGAFVGGTIATNAAGAATFKYGATRQWVEALTVVLASGDVLDVERGRTHAHAGGYFELDLERGRLRVPIPTYRMPAVAKLSAGYYSAPGMDLIDLFIGSEGTLGIVTEATLRVVSPRPAIALAFVSMTERRAALDLVRRLRQAAIDTWRNGDANGLDVSAIEHMDARCLQLLREDGIDRQLGVDLPNDAALAILIAIELPPATTAAQVYDAVGQFDADGDQNTPIGRFCRLLNDFNVLERTLVAAPGDRAQAAQLVALREAVPAAVNQRVGRAKATVDRRIEKTAADMIVPFEAFEAMLASYERELHARGLDVAIWGHISDGNVHPNVIPRSYADVEDGRKAIAILGCETIRLGGAPLAEHGVGRNRTKQQLLEDLYGREGIEEMRRTKAALDPEWKLAAGVLFPRGQLAI